MPANLETLYLQGLTLMFLFWNSARIFTYVPTILKLLRAGASARDYSLATWGCWVMSNGTFCLYLYEESGRVLNSMVLINAGNTLMCLGTCMLIFRLQHAEQPSPVIGTSADEKCAVDTSSQSVDSLHNNANNQPVPAMEPACLINQHPLP